MQVSPANADEIMGSMIVAPSPAATQTKEDVFRHPQAVAVRGIVFDMGDVFFDATIWRTWVLKLLKSLGYEFEYQAFYRVWDVDFLRKLHCGEGEYDDYFRQFILRMGVSGPHGDEVCASAKAQRRMIAARTRAYPSVAATLSALRTAGISLGVLSDSESPGEDLRRRLLNMKLGSFSAVISSRDLGVTKPHEKMYQAMLERLELSPAETVFVGHDADEITGAAAIGMRTIAVNHAPETIADAYLDCFEQLPKVIRRDKGTDA